MFKRVVHLTSINVKSNTYCTSFIEITSPTQTKLMTYDSEGIRTFYNKFFNAMAQIIAQNNGKILKNIGDGIASYFPKTSDYTDDSAIKDVLECSLIQIERQQSLSIDMAREKLPEISYKICTDYGVLNYEINLDDVFDKPPWLPPVYKICSTVSTNTAVLGDDLYKIITALPLIQEKYLIERIGEYIDDVRKNVPYSFYSLSRCPN